eukprot:5255623-Amphidinium_carterae.1
MQPTQSAVRRRGYAIQRVIGQNHSVSPTDRGCLYEALETFGSYFKGTDDPAKIILPTVQIEWCPAQSRHNEKAVG